MNTMPSDLTIAQECAYRPCGLLITSLKDEAESREYNACSFKIQNRVILFRSAKITPKKIGYFVTVWKRLGHGPIMPYNLDDPIDLFVISVRDSGRLGQFVFPKDVLFKQGYLSYKDKEGKRAMRVYPPWSTPDSMQARRTQQWQCAYFFEIMPTCDVIKLNTLFSCINLAS